MKRIHLLLAAAALLAVPAAAHNQWIKPSATVIGGEEGWVTFDAAVSTDVYDANFHPLQLEQIKASDPDGAPAPIEHGLAGQFRSAFDLHLTKPGTWRVGIDSFNVTGSYKLNGEDYRVGGRGRGGGQGGQGGGQGAQPAGTSVPGVPLGAGAAPGGEGRGPGGQNRGGFNPNAKVVPGGPDFTPPEGATDIKLTLSGARNEVFVTLGKPSAIRLSGKGLEMQPITHPADLVADEAGKFRFLVDGKPAAGLELEIIPDGRRYRNAQGTITVKTDANGVATVTWPAAGLYWLHTAFTDETSPRPGITGRRFQYTATLEVAAP